MDIRDCLKKLTENIVTKQNDSLESVKRLSQATDIISSDILNLINSSQMVGNRQFAENKIQDDDSSANGGRHNYTSTTTSPESTDKNATGRAIREDRLFTEGHGIGKDGCENTHELSLRSILLKAIKLLPPVEDEDNTLVDEDDKEEDRDEKSVDSVSTSVSEAMEEEMKETEESKEQRQIVSVAAEIANEIVKVVKPINACTEQGSNTGVEAPVANQESHVVVKSDEDDKVTSEAHQEQIASRRQHVDDINESVVDAMNEKVNKRPMNRDRVADILKKYSLYDDDEDEEEVDCE